VGPACGDSEDLTELIRAGVDVFRVNMAHGDRQEHQQRVDDIREASRVAGRLVAILVDLAGPKIRLGELPGGSVECVTEQQVHFVRGEQPSAPNELTTTYAPLIDELQTGDRIVLADGTVVLRVESSASDRVTCQIVQGGLLRSRQGVNLPGVRLSVPTLGEVDRDNALWAIGADVDYISLSFVRTADDVRQLKSLVHAEQSPAHVIAKIEKPEAVENLEEIVRAADGVMVARGDLGVEIDIAEVPVVQKDIVDCCRRHRKPVIIATQMLDSMQRSRLPTRAEATDVANAILDGADACMLSGETAIGQYPRESVETMERIALATEQLIRRRTPSAPVSMDDSDSPVTQHTTLAAGQLAEQLDARTMVAASATGRTALSVAKNRHFVPTVGVSDSQATLRKMCLYWGLFPLPDAPVHDNRQLLEFVIDKGKAEGFLAQGDRIVLISGTGMSTSRHNMIVVHEMQ
jgi:pyruvate kinase